MMVVVQDGWYDDRPCSFLVYAPCRTAVVYALVEDEAKNEVSVHESRLA